MLNPQTFLAIETSTSACSVALKIDGATHQLYEEGNNLHSKRLLAMVDELLKKYGVSFKQIELIAAGIGPGAFTGLRIGVGVTQGLAYSHNIPVLGVSSLQALAHSQTIMPNEFLVAALDARMSEMYWAVFRQNKSTLAHEAYCLSTPQKMSLRDEILQSSTIFVGNAWSIYSEQFSKQISGVLDKANVINLLPQAVNLIEYVCSQKEELDLKNCFELSPLYIRNDIAKKKRTNPLLR